jgi:hypothetical protein
MSDDHPGSRRLAAAQKRVAAARADVAAAREQVRTSRSRSPGAEARIVTACAASGVVAAVVAVVVGVAVHAQSGTESSDDVVRSASTAVATILTADPAHPDRYLAAARSVSGGEYRRRIDGAGPAIEDAVASLGGVGTGQVVAAGVAGGAVPSAGPADVLVVAETTAPQLVGGSAGDRRIALSVTMIRESGAWVIGQVTLR